MANNDTQQDLAAWIDRVRGREMPVFAHTIEALRALISDERASASALSQVILKDAAMTTKVLRLANSAFFNHLRQGVSTVSRAIVVLGFDPVAEMVLSVSLIDSLLAGGLRARVQTEMARSFHAAVQARWLAQRRGEGHAEEVFIAALLARVGEMAFWCFGGEQAQALDRCLAKASLREEEAQLVVLGFALRNLSIGLVREWKLGSLAVTALEDGARSRGPARSVMLGHRLARAAEEGWESPGGRQALREAAEFLDLPASALRNDILANAHEAARVARAFGAPEVARIIPQGAAPLEPEAPAVALPTGPDATLQLRVLHELAAMMMARAGLADILQLVAEGVLRGVGCERVVVALLTPDRRELQGRAALGAGSEALCARFVFPMEGDPEDVVDAAVDSRAACWVTPARAGRSGSERLQQRTACDQGFLVPFGSPSKVIGLLYADRGGKPMDEESWRAVQHFALQASLAVGMRAVEAEGVSPAR